MAAIGSVWKSGSWADDKWAVGTWATAAVVTYVYSFVRRLRMWHR